MSWSAVLALLVMIIGSCQKDLSQTAVGSFVEEASDRLEVDYSNYVGDVRAQACRVVSVVGSATDPRGAAISDKLWRPGQVITVSFYGGSSFVRERVIKYARQWEEFANVTFNFVESGGMLRVSFKQGAGSYAYYGTDALLIPYISFFPLETMNFGWFDETTPEEEFSRTTLHEFGHALGMIHEHQHPEVDLDWNREFVYEFFAGAPNYWTREQVDYNLFDAWSTSETTFNAYDQYSIMHYPILGQWINEQEDTPFNTVLSEGDKEFANIIYPF